MKKIFAQAIKPPPIMSISEWADKFRVLPSKGSAEPGKWRTSRTPYLKEIMDVLSPQHPAKEVVFVKATQIGGTEVGNNLLFYYMDLYPCPMLQVLHTEDIAKSHMRNKLIPSIKVMDRLNSKVVWAKGNRAGSSRTEVQFRGGELKLGWAQTTSTFASVSRRVVVCDDVDRWKDDVGQEGNPVALAKKRADAFENKKIFINSSPTLKNDSLIWEEFEDSDKRHFYMPCPHCKKHIKFEKEHFVYEQKNRELVGDVQYACYECGALIDEKEKFKMMSKGVWIAEDKERSKIGFRLPAFYSPWLGWREIFKEYIIAKADEERGKFNKMKTWVNTREALCYEEPLFGEELKFNMENLLARKEEYGVDVPKAVRILTAGVDTQNDRFEIEVVGWGEGLESWSIDYKIINGDPAEKETQNALDSYLESLFEHETGKKMQIYAVAIDTGGSKTQAMYEYCKKRYIKRFFAIKGSSKKDAPITTGRFKTSNKGNVALFQIGVNAAKDEFFSALAKETPGPLYCHFPKKDIYDKDYFKQLISEVKVAGVWKKPHNKIRNEALDVRVYARAALAITGVDVDLLSKQDRFMGLVLQKKRVKQKTKAKKSSSSSSYLDEY